MKDKNATNVKIRRHLAICKKCAAAHPNFLRRAIWMNATSLAADIKYAEAQPDPSRKAAWVYATSRAASARVFAWCPDEGIVRYDGVISPICLSCPYLAEHAAASALAADTTARSNNEQVPVDYIGRI
jgi:hypothetical protein